MIRSSGHALRTWSTAAVGIVLGVALWNPSIQGQAPAGAPAPAAPAPAAPATPTPPPVPQGPPAPTTVGQATAAPTVVEQGTDGGTLHLFAGRSMVLNEPFDIRRFSFTNTTVADGTVVSPRELLIDGRAAGTISLILWGEQTRIHYEVVVDPSVTTLEQRLHDLFPGEDIRVSVSEGAVILSGHVSSNEIMLRAAEIAATSQPNQHVINMLQLPAGGGSQQVMLQVRFAEVNHKAVEQLGINLFSTRTGFTSRSTTDQFPAPTFDDSGTGGLGGLVFSDFLNLFFFQRNQGIGAVMQALQQNGNFESLAEPNLIAYNGVEAQFLAGGEIPVPVVTGSNGGVSVTYKEFGIRLKFKPTIAGDVIRLHLRPEVSSLDFANGVTLSGFRIPALTTRYAETEVELRDGQSFAIAGLLDNVGQEDKAAIPILSQLPIIGSIFKSKDVNKSTTELLVLVTPRLVRPLNPDEVPPLPSLNSPTPASPNGPQPGVNGGGGGAGLIDAPAVESTRPSSGTARR